MLNKIPTSWYEYVELYTLAENPALLSLTKERRIMLTVINAACITPATRRSKRTILLVYKIVDGKGVWILPGGKIKNDEGDIDCLIREIGEELPAARINNIKWYGQFDGTTPHTGQPVVVKVSLAEIEGNITPAGEISQSGFFSKIQLGEIVLSPITSRIIDSLIEDKLL